MSDRDNVLFGLDLQRKTFRSGDGDGMVVEGPQGNRISTLQGTEPTDLTAQKPAQDEVRRHNAELEQQVNIRTAELQAANQVLEAFSYAVAHDLRAPLRHIRGFSDLLQSDTDSALSADGRHYLDCVVNGCIRMEALLGDLLKLSRFSRQAVNWQMIRLSELVQEVIGELAPETANRKIEWKIGELPRANCDPALMKVVFANLLSNAVKFTRPRPTATIEVGQQALNGETVLFVRDNGTGFDMKYAGKLFGVFQRMHKEKDFEGTGVGLATVQRILQKHGERIWAEAEPDKGATFYFTCRDAEVIRERQAAVGR
jgi:light-regulated signal transduction histidine kinase (bacteriophytochrome)